MANPYPDIHEGRDDHPEEWQSLQHAGTGDHLRDVEWDPVTNQVRMTAPVVLGQRPEAPAP